MGPIARAFNWTQKTLAGRLVFGPIAVTAQLLASGVARLARGDRRYAFVWLAHLALVAGVVMWLHFVCDVGIARYLLGFAYPGWALTLLRSFIEHRPGSTQARSSAILEAGPIASLLFLNNNLHALHHADPDLPWYELPARFRAVRDEILARNGGFRFSGYMELALRYSFSPVGSPVHTPRAAIVRSAGDERAARSP
jgi:fatty acid desaturase